MKPHVCLILGFAVVAGNAATDGYVDSVRAWQRTRDSSLRSRQGWLTLAGLFWLTPGREETIGSASESDCPLPDSAPEHLGRLRLENGKVLFTNMAGASVTADGRSVLEEDLSTDVSEHPTVVRAGSVSFSAIRRGDKFGIRVRDAQSKVLEQFHGMHYFPINPAWKFAAKFVPDPKKIPILNIIGQTDLEESPGYVEFEKEGKRFHLRPVYEGNSLFFLFKDETNKTETYQAGRMLNTPLPKAGTVELDFNLSYNPPCTFTPYATCPLPPRENYLSTSITAGEKRYGHGHEEGEAEEQTKEH